MKKKLINILEIRLVMARTRSRNVCREETAMNASNRNLAIRHFFIVKILVGISLAIMVSTVCAQTTSAPKVSTEMKYYDFWPGTWALVVNGKIDEKASSFRVSRGIHDAAFDEEWRLVNEKGEVLVSRGMRAWDQASSRWMFAWVSANALFQVWEGRKFGDDWYIVREFEADGRKFLSRQALLQGGPDRIVWVSERSNDGGKTWEPRFRQEFGRLKHS